MGIKQTAIDMVKGTPAGRVLLKGRRQIVEPIREQKILKSQFSFVNRQKNHSKLCIILAGYKEPLWEDVFGRLAAFAPADMDVCVMTSGLVNDDLREIARKNDWSYLSTEINHLSHIQNLAIRLHPNAEWIYKLDEDIFLTEGVFEKMLETWHEVEDNSLYNPAFVAPLINVNGFTHLRILEKLGLLDAFRETGMTDMKYTEGVRADLNISQNPDVSRYMWGETEPVLRDIDALAARFAQEPPSYSVCPMRFSIGAILFSRANWMQFGGFPVTFYGSKYGLGDDEEHISIYAGYYGKAIIICENALVGHLGYGGQTAAMMEYYEQHRDRFALPASFR